MEQLRCRYCKVPLEALEEENEAMWGEDWPLMDPDELEYYCHSCNTSDYGWAIKDDGNDD